MPIDPSFRQQILASVERFVADRVAPRAAEIDASDTFPADLYREAAALGVFGLWIPEAYSGIGPDLVTPLLISDVIARVSPSFALIFSNCGDAVTPIVNFGTDAQKSWLLPKIASGDLIPCFALTEPGAGSDAASITTQARAVDGGYVLSGRKMWITNGGVGDIFTVFAKTDPEAGNKGISAFLVERGARGFTIGRNEDLIGLRGCPTTELMFEDVFVPADRILGEKNRGFKIAMSTLDEARLNCSAMALGAATGALQCAIDYAKERVQFGKPIIEHQGLAFLLADCAARLTGARAIWQRAMAALEADRSREASTLAAMAKLLCTETAMRVTTECVQAMGANGLSKAYPVERFMRDCKPFEVFDGTSQIQKLLIGRYLEKYGLPDIAEAEIAARGMATG
ncbi:acyl-CoA dehydrogenase family protein [Rhodoligotrophos defluvii]|uniref:acyl-CoA dehydrogenase family protein n=1 Tax=Rhodoligotrophos defluvii TaxID=2561934 RepID=UPI0010C9D9EE|nr:acyl-CoA dehydrogenase family protein [Rhodoligotrophos defluvii]